MRHPLRTTLCSLCSPPSCQHRISSATRPVGPRYTIVRASDPCHSKLTTVTTASGRIPRTAVSGWRSSSFNGVPCALLAGLSQDFIAGLSAGVLIRNKFASSARDNAARRATISSGGQLPCQTDYGVVSRCSVKARSSSPVWGPTAAHTSSAL